MDSIGTAIGLAYFAPHELQDSDIDGRMLGMVAFGLRPDNILPEDHPYAWIDMPVLGGTTLFEVWRSEQPVVRENVHGIRTARNEEVLFGCLETALDHPMDEAAYGAYCRMLDFIDARGYAALLRVWNYFPGINENDHGLERYRRFSGGRHEAFAAKRRSAGRSAPAACALGSRSGPLTVCFLAARNAGTAIENPRQVSAYHYPPQYGPRAPLFSRGMLARPGGRPLLFISGTASIVGHETAYGGHPREQAAETVRNARAVIEEASRSGLAANDASSPQLKAYVRHPGDLPVVRDEIERAFGPTAEVAYLQADICRSDLLVEVEGVCASGKS